MKKGRATYRGIVVNVRMHVVPNQPDSNKVFCSLRFKGGAAVKTCNFDKRCLKTDVKTFVGKRRKHINSVIRGEMEAFRQIDNLINGKRDTHGTITGRQITTQSGIKLI